MAYIRRADIERHQAGSLEQRVAAVRTAAVEQLGAGATVLATHADHAIVRTPERVVCLGYALAEGAAQAAGEPTAADVPILAGLDLDAAAGEAIRGIAEAWARGERVPRTRVHDLAHMARRDRSYWLGEALDACGAGEPAWVAWYAPQGATVREALHGQIRALEEPVPRTRYAKLGPEALAGAEAELRESMGALAAAARGVFDDLTRDVAYQEAGLAAVHQSLQAEAGTMAEGLAWVARMDWTGRLPEVAAAHDRIAARLRDGVVVQAHLRGAETKEQA